MTKTVETRQTTAEGEKQNERYLKLCFSSQLVSLLLLFKPAILLKFLHFQLSIQNKRLRLLVVLGLPLILTFIIFLTNVFTNKADTVEPRFNEVAGDRPNLFVKSRVR